MHVGRDDEEAAGAGAHVGVAGLHVDRVLLGQHLDLLVAEGVLAAQQFFLLLLLF